MSHISRRTTLLLASAVFVALLWVYSSTDSPLPTWDAYANVFPALSLLNDGNLNISPSEIPFLFVWSLPATGRRLQISQWNRMIIAGTSAEDLYRAGKLRPEREAYYFMLRTPGGEYVGTEPPGTALAAAPFFYWMALPDTAASLRNAVPFVQKSKGIAAVFTAATAAIIFATSVRRLRPLRALLVAMIFGLGTCAWSLGSQALWAQTGMQPFLALGIDQFLRIRDRRAYAVTAGFALGCAVCCRSTSVVVLAAIGVFLLVKDRKALGLCCAGALLPLAFLASYNDRYFGSPLTEAHALMGPAIALAKTGSPDLWQTPLWQGALGLLFSPARGLFVYSPILVLAFWGAYRVLRDRAEPEFLPLIAAVVVVMIVRFKWFDWWGGYSYGYRPLLDAIVPLTVLVIPAIGTRHHGVVRRGVFAVLLLWSIGVQFIGTAYDGQSWDRRTIFQVRAPDGVATDFFDRDEAAAFAKARGQTVSRVSCNIDDPLHRDRLWSIRDNPIVYYAVHRREALAVRDASLGELMRAPVEVRRVE